MRPWTLLCVALLAFPAGRGVLIAAFATHGFSIDGVSYVLASSSAFDLFFDACRQGMRPGVRAPVAPPLYEGLTHAAGQVVFAISGAYALDNQLARNGAFTGILIAGLQCKAKTDARGLVTVATLRAYAEKRLKPHVRNAVELTVTGEMGAMPLAQCIPPALPVSPVRVAADDTSFTAFDARNMELWRTTFAGRVAHAEVADLGGDRRRRRPRHVRASRPAATAADREPARKPEQRLQARPEERAGGSAALPPQPRHRHAALVRLPPHPAAQSIERLKIVDRNRDGRRDTPSPPPPAFSISISPGRSSRRRTPSSVW